MAPLENQKSELYSIYSVKDKFESFGKMPLEVKCFFWMKLVAKFKHVARLIWVIGGAGHWG